MNVGTAFSIGSNDPGFFDAGLGIVPGVNSYEVAVFQLRAWTGAPTFEAASQQVASARKCSTGLYCVTTRKKHLANLMSGSALAHYGSQWSVFRRFMSRGRH